jgi:peptide/nickel transport system substrate-binding protein
MHFPRTWLRCVVSALLTSTAIASVAPGATASTRVESSATSNLTYDGLPVLRITGTGGGPAANFNPFLPTSALSGYSAVNMIYEPLVQFNLLRANATYPWLATSWKWSNSDKTLTFQLRHGVKWTDGTGFTSSDVVFTFDLLKANAALDVNAVSFKTIKATGPYSVAMTFAQPSYAEFYSIAGLTPIVPQHIWKSVKKPSTYLDLDPVGTGPFVYKSYNPQLFVLTRNPHYWQAGKPEIGELLYYGLSFDTAGLELKNGQLDWADYFYTSGHNSSFTKKSSYNHYFYPSVAVNDIVPNLKVYPLNVLAVRQAISLAINRQEVTLLGEYGFEPPVVTATGLILPADASLVAPSYAHSNLGYNVKKALQVLEKAGFKLSNGVLTKNGQPVRMTLLGPSGYHDWMDDLSVIAADLKQIGIIATVQGVAVPTWAQRLANGQFDLTINGSTEGPTPYTAYDGWLDDTLSAPVGHSAIGDQERWYDPATQRDLHSYLTATTAAGRTAALYRLEGVMVQQLPVIPLVYAVDWGMYSASRVVGWPSASDPYDLGSPYTPNAEVVVLHLHAR